MPFIPPMLCSRLERRERLTERRYIAEPKLDGAVHILNGARSPATGCPGRDAERDATASVVCAAVEVKS
jgi:hypothetical protein